MEFSSTVAAVFTVALLLAAALGQAQQLDCFTNLVAKCIQDLSSPKPSAPCCTAIKEVFDTQLTCLCNLYRNPEILIKAGIDFSQAVELPKHCNISADANTCNAVSPASAPGSSVSIPPATPGGNGNAAGQISWMGMPALLLVAAFAALY